MHLKTGVLAMTLTKEKSMDELKYAKERFARDPTLLELQVWESKTAEYFAMNGYSVLAMKDGSWWVTDESRYMD